MDCPALRARNGLVCPGAATAIETLQVIGDALAPGLIADAVFSGHLTARDFQRDPDEVERELYLREIPAL